MTSGLVSLALGLMDSSRLSGVTIRLVGSVGILVLMKSDGEGRPHPPKDIDLAARASERVGVQSFLKAKGWSMSKRLLLVAELRETYFSGGNDSTLDVFYDVIDGNHPISIKYRLTSSWPTLSWTDLLLTKLQRREMRPEDVWDVILLASSIENLDRAYFQAVIGSDWGLYTTITDNLESIKATAPQRIRELTRLQETASHAPKAAAWRIRSIVGRHAKWWREVSPGYARS
jgi:hypothetical protein